MNIAQPMSINTYNLELFFELSPDLLCIAGYDGFFKRINPSVSKLLGYSIEELYSKPIDEFIHPHDRHITGKWRFELTKSNPLYNFENRYITKSGETVWLSWTSLPLEDEALIFAIAKNITHKKKQEEERNLLVSHLTSLNNELKQLTYTTSHDLRSPVNNLLCIFEMLDLSKIHDEDTLTIIDLLKSAGNSLKHTVNNYVDALSHHDIHVSLETLSFNEILEDVIQSINSLITSSKVNFQINFSSLEQITFHKPFLESIFLNLITNSIKYAQPGIPPVISIRTELENGVKKLIVKDNGLGFDMEKVKDKIFGLHQKFHNHTDSKGIGLYLVHNHITSLGGRIKVDSAINRGTTFTITFK